MQRRHWPISEFETRQGTEIGVSDWILVDQDRIDAFANVTLDEQYIHVDPIRAEATAFGGTIAHGFLSLSLLSALSYSAIPAIDDEKTGVNYGFGQVRFVTPVRSGRRVRGRFKLKSISEKHKGRWVLTFDVSVEIDGEPKPALVAEWITMSIV